ncbi:pseudouridine synthase [bacterium SCSIO 12741]|nr:pseudouridine synthase [bacterium SCSIO 12741]
MADSSSSSFRYYVLYKPFGYVSRFTDEDGNPGLGRILDVEKDVYPVGRLDKDSEGLLILTNDPGVNAQLLRAENEHPKTYLVQVEGEITSEALSQLEAGITIRIKKQDYTTLPAKAERVDSPTLPDRDPPIRFRKNVPTSWISLQLIEGKNRQVRRMTAAVGFPTLRLVRAASGNLKLPPLQPGEYTAIDQADFYRLLQIKPQVRKPAKPQGNRRSYRKRNY